MGPSNSSEGDGTQRPLWVCDAVGWFLPQGPPTALDNAVNPPLNSRMEKQQLPGTLLDVKCWVSE